MPLILSSQVFIRQQQSMVRRSRAGHLAMPLMV